MMTVGGVISGYWATGKPSDAMIPAMTMTMEMTDAKIGRLMKKRDMIGWFPCLVPLIAWPGLQTGYQLAGPVPCLLPRRLA